MSRRARCRDLRRCRLALGDGVRLRRTDSPLLGRFSPELEHLERGSTQVRHRRVRARSPVRTSGSVAGSRFTPPGRAIPVEVDAGPSDGLGPAVRIFPVPMPGTRPVASGRLRHASPRRLVAVGCCLAKGAGRWTATWGPLGSNCRAKDPFGGNAEVRRSPADRVPVPARAARPRKPAREK